MEKSDAPILVIDKNKERLIQLKNSAIERIRCDGPTFLAKNFHLLNPSNRIVPAVPIHLAFEWLKNYFHRDWRIRQTEIRLDSNLSLPHSWPGSEGSLLISYADFLCPEDCPEPAGYCQATGKKRDIPLYELLSRLTVDDHKIHVIRSHQIAPGLGGYEVDDLRKLGDRVRRGGEGKWLVATACKCHGTLTAMEIFPAKNKSD
jgi:hypothetical protein